MTEEEKERLIRRVEEILNSIPKEKREYVLCVLQAFQEDHEDNERKEKDDSV